MPWFMIKLDGWRRWLLGFSRKKKISESQQCFLIFQLYIVFCVQLMDAMKLTLRFINYDVPCIASHRIAMQCSWPSFVYFILLWDWFIFFPSQYVSAPFVFLFVLFFVGFYYAEIPCALKSALHIRYSDVYFCIMSINVFSFCPFSFLRYFCIYADGLLCDLFTPFGLSTLRHCSGCCHRK